MALTDLATVRQAVPRLASLSDAEVTRLIGECSGIITDWLCRNLDDGITSYTETLTPDGSGKVFLANRPVVSITSVTVGLPNSPQTIDPSTYQFDPDSGEIRGNSSPSWFWPFDFLGGYPGTLPVGYGWRSLQVVYTAGVSDVPPAVAGRCIAVLNRAAGALAHDPTATSKKAGNLENAWSMVKDALLLTPDDFRILSKYKTWSL